MLDISVNLNQLDTPLNLTLLLGFQTLLKKTNKTAKNV